MSTKTAYLSYETDPDEWTAAWKNLAAKFGSCDCCDSETHEVWEYMGSVFEDMSGRWIHGFRHRSLPPTGDHATWTCFASAGWKPKSWGTMDLATECPF